MKFSQRNWDISAFRFDRFTGLVVLAFLVEMKLGRKDFDICIHKSYLFAWLSRQHSLVRCWIWFSPHLQIPESSSWLSPPCRSPPWPSHAHWWRSPRVTKCHSGYLYIILASHFLSQKIELIFTLLRHSLGSDVSDHFFWSEYWVNQTRFHSLSSEFSLYSS